MTSTRASTGRITRRRLTQVVGAGAGLAAAGWTRARPAAVAAQAAGELIIGVSQDTYRTEPAERANIGYYPLNTNIFESLVRLAPDYTIEPLLAESWELIEPSTYRFTLREGVTFHDGTPFTAEAVAWSLGRIAAAGGGQIGVDESSVVIVDDYTVEITPAAPNLRLIQQIGHPNNSIIAPNSNPAEVRIGTGPYREVEYVIEDRYVVEANPDYWGEDQPQVQQLTFRFFPDATTRLLALEAGEVDLISQVPRESAAQLGLTGADLRLITTPVGAYEALYVNLHGAAPYDLGQDPAIRQALGMAIDKEAIVSGVWQGYAEIGTTMIPPAILGPAAEDVAAIAYDPDGASAVLEEAGWTVGADGIREKEGRPLTLTMIVGFPNADIHRPMPEFVQAQLQAVGIGLEIVLTPDTAIYEERLVTGEGDLWAEAGSQNDGDPCFLPSLLFASPVEGGDAESNMYGNAFAPGIAFDEQVTACRTAVEPAAVQTAAAGMMATLINDDFVVIPLAGTFGLYGASAKVADFAPHPSGINQRWTALSLTE